LYEELHIASVLATHDQEEATEVADRAAVVNQGRIEQVGTPLEAYDNPANSLVCRFVGDVSLFHERTEPGKPHTGDAARTAARGHRELAGRRNRP
jgi:sulfate transport system ATP-binding protein